LTRTQPSKAAAGITLSGTVGRNTLFGVIARAVQVTTRMVTVPVVIAHLGLEGYGIWAIIMATAAYMRFGSIGIKSAFQKYVAEATGDKNFQHASQLLSTGCAAMLALSLAGLIPVAVFSKVLARASGVPSDFLQSAAGAITLLALIMVLSNVGAAYEAILTGGHRIDLARNLGSCFTVSEAVLIIVLLNFGHGLFAMACVMAASEVGFVLACFLASRRVLPQVCVSRKFVTGSVGRELVRYAGSYQLVNILEVLYLSIIPFTVLREFGAQTSGVYALTTRLTQTALTLPDAFLAPILSGAAMVYASSSSEQMRILVAKAFKVNLLLSFFPLAFLAVFGSSIVSAWTGQAIPEFRGILWLVCTAGFFQTISLLGLVLYRVSGNALLDNVRQGLRIVVLLAIALFARRLGLQGVLGGLALAEFVGMVFMVFAIKKTFHSFDARPVIGDAVRLATSAGLVLGACFIAERLVPSPSVIGARGFALLRLTKVGFVCMLATWPALLATRFMTRTEGSGLVRALLPDRRSRSEVRNVRAR
jgi:O-antigen/teichoic acid export membrane protein